MKENQHVTPRKNGWAVKKENGKKASKIFLTRWGAVRYARRLTEKDNSCLVIHRPTGEFEKIECD